MSLSITKFIDIPVLFVNVDGIPRKTGLLANGISSVAGLMGLHGRVTAGGLSEFRHNTKSKYAEFDTRFGANYGYVVAKLGPVERLIGFYDKKEWELVGVMDAKMNEGSARASQETFYELQANAKHLSLHLRHLVHRADFVLICAHLPKSTQKEDGKDKRAEESLRMHIQQLRKLGLPYIDGGDFNRGPDFLFDLLKPDYFLVDNINYLTTVRSSIDNVMAGGGMSIVDGAIGPCMPFTHCPIYARCRLSLPLSDSPVEQKLENKEKEMQSPVTFSCNFSIGCGVNMSPSLIQALEGYGYKHHQIDRFHIFLGDVTADKWEFDSDMQTEAGQHSACFLLQHQYCDQKKQWWEIFVVDPEAGDEKYDPMQDRKNQVQDRQVSVRAVFGFPASTRKPRKYATASMYSHACQRTHWKLRELHEGWHLLRSSISRSSCLYQ